MITVFTSLYSLGDNVLEVTPRSVFQQRGKVSGRPVLHSTVGSVLEAFKRLMLFAQR